MANTRLNLDEFPDSPHVRELRRDSTPLRFEPELEQEYRREHILRQRARIRHFANIVLFLSVAFSIEKLVREGGWTPPVVLHFALLLPLVAALLWLIHSRHFANWFGPAIRFIAPALGGLLVFLCAASMARGMVEDLAIPVLVQVSIFLFMGLLFWDALAISILVLVLFIASSLFVGMPLPLFFKSALVLAAAAGLAAKIGRETELAQRARFLEQALLEQLADHDGLTGLQNRRRFDERLIELWSQGMRQRRRIALMLIDLDHFKDYNDAYGHQAGDAALKAVAAVVRNFARRPLDVAARYGGEELAAILYDISPQDAATMGERLRAAVESLGIEHSESGCAAVVTVSIGIAPLIPEPGRTPDGALQLADQALYRAKEEGRNRCVSADADEYAMLVTGRFERSELPPAVNNRS